MKVIDLLNKIANGTKVPKIIKYNDYILYYEEDMKDYYDGEGNHPLLDTQCQFILNDEIEIIEDAPENKKIEKLNLIFEDKFIKEQFESGAVSYLDNYTAIKMIYEKQCEIIDKIKGE